MLDASSSGVFQTRSMEEKWDLIERIQKNTEDWEIDKGIEPAINYEHDYIESYVKTDVTPSLSVNSNHCYYSFNYCSKLLSDQLGSVQIQFPLCYGECNVIMTLVNLN